MKQIKTLSPRHSSLHIVWHAKGVVLKQGFMGMGGQTVDQPYPAILSATKPKKQNKHPKQRYPATLEANTAKQTRQTAISRSTVGQCSYTQQRRCATQPDQFAWLARSLAGYQPAKEVGCPQSPNQYSSECLKQWLARVSRAG